MPTIDDAHRSHELGRVLALVGKNLAAQYGQSSVPHDSAHTGCTTAITDLTAIQAPPGDVQTYVDAEMQALRDSAVSTQSMWASIITDDPEAPYLYAAEYAAEQASPGYAAATKSYVDNYIAAIDAEWTPAP